MKKVFIYFFIVIFILIGLFLLKNSKKDSGKTQIVFWTLQMGTFSDYINPLIDKYESQNPKIKIIWIDVPYSEGEKRTLSAMLSDNPPDLINLTPEFSILLAQRKALELIDKSQMSQYLPSIVDQLKIGEKYYAFPFYATTALTVYNDNLLKKSTLNSLPKTYDQVFSYAKDVKRSTGAYITMPTLTENDTLLKILNKYNINTSESLLSKTSKNIFSQIKDIYRLDFIPKESITLSHREALEKYMSGQLLLLPAGANFLNIIKENAPLIYDNTDVAPQLIGATGKYDLSLMNLVVPKKSKNKEESIKFALYLTNQENQLKLAKLTSIMPVNKDALNDKYFKDYDSNDLMSKARAISAKQLLNIQPPLKSEKQKELVVQTNNSLQMIVLNKKNIDQALNELSEVWKELLN